MSKSRLLILLCLVLNSYEKSTPQDDHYVGAVVEYLVTGNVATNLVNYANLIKEAAEQGADIVVFPEDTLTNSSTYFTVPIYGALKNYPIPALYPTMFDEVMVAISTAARANQIYVVINGRELMDCTIQNTGENCPEEKSYMFKTNVVFDRTGAVIDRFRKINLFRQESYTPALKPDLGVFTTDFGVTFGHFICFDLMFQIPAVQVVQKMNIKDVIFPTMWYSELPYLTAVQIQEAYAYALDVNFLGSGANNVRVGSGGSGIYSGKAGALISIMPGLPTTKVLVAKVPKVPGEVSGTYPGPIYDEPTNMNNMRLIVDPSLASHVTKLLEPGTQEFTLVDKDVSCTFRVTLSQRNSQIYYRYRAGVFSGVRSYSGVATGGVRICGVYACTGDARDTCGLRFAPYLADTTAIFDELTITATMPTPSLEADLDTNDSIVYPVSSTIYIMPLESEEYSYTVTPNNDVTVHTMSLKNKTAELYAFAIWGRRFATDGQVEDPPLPDDETTTESTSEVTTQSSEATTVSTSEATTTTEATADASVVHLLSHTLLVMAVTVICYSQF
nr:vanin-like protein 3 isoform X5 [Helicoverpa armigera]